MCKNRPMPSVILQELENALEEPESLKLVRTGYATARPQLPAAK